ncbi:type II secretion system minor pseudopilin GspH [Candidatus Enterovibrio escicola]|uniref:Type II secretion system protein H n=2 Tax=Candidatus Enterovibrio escicola TaxID=1927127 RepID=A0A2A5SYY8_9GAMM|nr:General secretion pathway protein H [Candidatus Enterovibrio escacola]
MKSTHPTGFTLMEILLVLLLLAVTAVVVVPNFWQSQSDEAKKEAQRFYQLIQLWTEQALLTGQTFGLRVENNHYTLNKLTPENWQPVTEGRYAYAVSMPEGIRLELEVTSFLAEENRLFERESLFNYNMFIVEDNKRKPPQVALMGNGEIIPFTLTFIANKKRLWRVNGNEVAIFEINALNENKE